MEEADKVQQAAELAEQVSASMSSEQFTTFALQTLMEGGWLMIPLALLALLIYFEAMSLILRMSKAKLKKTPRAVWSKWLDTPAEGTGHVGEVIRYVVGNGIVSDDAVLRVEAVKSKLLPDVNARIVVLSILVTIAPLMGLLGTVIGMLTTFRGLATASGQAVDLVAEGIRVALITTQTGLMIAIPGYIFISLVIRSRNNYLAFLAELETAVVQRVHKLEDTQ
jgi:biopolymer transport protein ExbB